jgi:hypothetical protein
VPGTSGERRHDIYYEKQLKKNFENILEEGQLQEIKH